MIDRAAKFAEQAHKGAHRKGTRIPYIVHPLETALIASMLTNDEEILAAALLHAYIFHLYTLYKHTSYTFAILLMFPIAYIQLGILSPVRLINSHLALN